MSSISARSLIGWGVNRRAMVPIRMVMAAGETGFGMEENTVSCSLVSSGTAVSTKGHRDVRQCKLKRIVCVTIFMTKWPRHLFIQFFQSFFFV